MSPQRIVRAALLHRGAITTIGAVMLYVLASPHPGLYVAHVVHMGAELVLAVIFLLLVKAAAIGHIEINQECG